MQVSDPKNAFYGWYEFQVPRTLIRMFNGRVTASEMDSEITGWLLKNIGSSGRSTWVSHQAQKGYRVLIKDREKALLFKLTMT